MTVFGIAMVRDEADILPSILRHMLDEGLDHLIVADNLSTDGTRDHLEDFARNAPLTVVDDPEVAYYQARKMTRLAHQAGGMGADWIVPFDADELWYSPFGQLAGILKGAREPIQYAEGLYHVPHPDDPDDPDPIVRMVHRRAGRNCPQSKVAFRYHPEVVLHQGNHEVDRPGTRCVGLIAFREFQYRSFEHFVRKVRHGKVAYDATDLAEDCGIHWRRLGAMTDQELRAEWDAYLRTPTEYDPAPVREVSHGLR